MLSVKWGPYFKADIAEQQKVVTLVQEALGKSGEQLITRKMAAEKLASAGFPVEDVDALLAEIDKEKAQRVAEAQDRMREDQASLHPMAAGITNGENPRGNRPRGGSEPPEDAGGRSGDPTASSPPSRFSP